MGLPATYCSICGGPFGNPYSSVADESSDANFLQKHVEDEFEWLSSACLFGIPSSLQTPKDAKLLPYSDMPAYRPSNEQPAFFGDSSSTYGSELSSFCLNGQTHHLAHYPGDNGDILFAMHITCAEFIQRVYKAKSDGLVAHGCLPTVRSFYDKLRKECLRSADEWGNVYWPHDYYGAIEHWGYNDWEYGEGCVKYLLNPLHDRSLTTFALELLKPAQNQLRLQQDLTRETASNRINLESLPTEIVDQIVSLLPAPSAYSLRLVSSRLASKIPLNQQFFRQQLLGGNIVPFIWDLDAQACRNMQRRTPEGEDADEYWDWRQLAHDLSDVKGIVERGPDDNDNPIPSGLWNRCRLWLTVVETDLW